jgi:hypothetical protein
VQRRVGDIYLQVLLWAINCPDACPCRSIVPASRTPKACSRHPFWAPCLLLSPQARMCVRCFSTLALARVLSEAIPAELLNQLFESRKTNGFIIAQGHDKIASHLSSGKVRIVLTSSQRRRDTGSCIISLPSRDFDGTGIWSQASFDGIDGYI